MKQYDSYKDSGVEWIGEVPSHWEVMKTSLAFHGIGSGTTPSTSKKEFYDENDGYYWLQTGDLNDGIINETSKKVTKFAISQCNLKFYPKDSIVIAMYGATIGKVGILGIKTATNQACCVLPTNKNMNAKFAFYEFLACKPALLVSAIGGGQPNISQDVIRKQKIVIPPLLEQTAIASYLDKKCTEIDKVISAQQKRIALLQKLKQSIITHAVSKGLNPNVEMKDSGVEWIGNVPSHWEVKKTSLAFNGIGSGTTPSTSKKEFYDDEGKFWLQTGDLNDGMIFETSKKVSDIAIKVCNLKFYPKDSVVIAMYGATIGKVGILGIKAATNQACCVLPANKHMIAKYSFYEFLACKPALLVSAIGGGQPNISQDTIKKQKIVVPPKGEQQAIADYLDVKCSLMDKSISKAQHQVELLQEYKQSLITEVVTGKRKVS